MIFPITLFAQVNIDSLWSVWHDETQNDTNRARVLHNIVYFDYLFKDPDSAFILAQQVYDFSEENSVTNYKAKALNLQGISLYIRGKQDSAIVYWERCFQILKEIGDKKGLSNPLNNIGISYLDQGNHAKALEYFKKALKISEEVRDTSAMATNLLSIGNIYSNQKDLSTALDYYQKSSKFHEQSGNKRGWAIALGNIGNIYIDQNNYNEALKYFKKSYQIHFGEGNNSGMTESLAYISKLNLLLEDYDKAIEVGLQAIKIGEEGGFKHELSNALKNVGNAYKKKGDYSKALNFCKRANQVSKEVGESMVYRESCKSLWEIYKALGKMGEALEMYELYIETRDSIASEENQRASIEMRFQIEYEKKAAADSVAHEKEQEIKQSKIDKQQAEIKAQKNRQYALFAGIGMILIFSGFMFNRYRVTQRQKIIIQETNEELNMSNEELAAQRDQIELQRENLQHKNEEITASINYAKRIQDAIMPPFDSFKEVFGNSFVLYEPKDIVAGDFFWMENLGSEVFFAAADCTGHGVPGAMVSVVCSNALNKALLEEGIKETNKLLDRARELVIETLAKSGEEVKDGMDISICCLNINTNEMQWSGANNPLWILRKDAEEFEIIKGNKQPVGIHPKPEPFVAHQVQLSEGDTIYVFTDGYQDQFGGPTYSKFKAKQLKQLIIDNQNMSMEQQHHVLYKTFKDWMGSEEQIDDVCVIGVRI